MIDPYYVVAFAIEGGIGVAVWVFSGRLLRRIASKYGVKT